MPRGDALPGPPDTADRSWPAPMTLPRGDTGPSPCVLACFSGKWLLAGLALGTLGAGPPAPWSPPQSPWTQHLTCPTGEAAPGGSAG